MNSQQTSLINRQLQNTNDIQRELSIASSQAFQRSSDMIEYVSFDEILSKIGFGQYQWQVFIIMGFCGIMDGSQSLVLSLVLPILQKEWNLQEFEQSLLGSLVYVGLMIGSYFSGYFADKQGRQKPLVVASIVIFMFALSSAFSFNFTYFLITRFLYGVGVGFIMPISFTIIGENIPVKERGFFLVLIGVFYTLGELLACLIAFFTMNSLTNGNWRALLAFSSIPAFLVFVLTLKFIDEPARFLLSSNNFLQAHQVLMKIAQSNNKDPEEFIHARVMLQLKAWADRNKLEELELKKNEKQNIFAGIKELFSGSFKQITPIIWYNWFTSSFVYFGISFIFPLTLTQIGENNHDDDQNSNLDLWQITISSLGELPTLVIAAFIVNIPKFGRQNTWGLAFLLGGIALVLVFFELPTLVLWITIAKLSLDLAFSLSYQYTTEIYPTYMRTNGLGIAGSFSRIGGIMMPWIGIYISKIGIYFPYFIFGITSLISGVLTFMLPYDTLNLELDTVK